MKSQNDQSTFAQNSLDRRDFLKISGVGAAALILGPTALAGDILAGSSRPNILYIHSHDTGRYTSPYGHSVPTPNLLRLAAEGVLFRQAHTPAPTCSPSRACMLTGQYAHNNGMLGLVNRGFEMTSEGYSHHIVRYLKEKAGYYSALIGLQHIAKDPHTIGYDHVESFHGDHVEQVAPAAVKFLHSAPKQPFWLSVGFFETHRKYRPAGPEDDWRVIEPPAPLPDVPATRRDMADFHATVRKMDWGVGEVLAALEKTGLAANTLVISTTDHGLPMPTMKCNLYDGGMGVHMIMRGPGGFTGGKVCDALISQLDIYPTLCDLLNIPPPPWLQGRSFLPVLRGETPEINDAIFSEVNFHVAYEPMRAVRTKQWKYIRHFGGRTTPVLPNCDRGPSKEYWVANGWAKQTVATEELYDLIFDPNERNNLAKDSSHESILIELRKRMDDWMQSTNDPLLHGPIQPPPGVRLDDPDEVGDPSAMA